MIIKHKNIGMAERVGFEPTQPLGFAKRISFRPPQGAVL